MSRKAPTIEHYMSQLPHTTTPEATLDDAHQVMRKYQIRHLPVVAEGKVVGVVSVRDLHLIESLKDVDPGEVPVADAMTSPAYVVEASTPLDSVVSKMAAEKIGSAVVMRRGEIAGIFTTTDAMTALFHLWKKAP